MTRPPYIGLGADGCRRSAQVDREQADVTGDVLERERLLASAAAWEAEADRLTAAARGPRV